MGFFVVSQQRMIHLLNSRKENTDVLGMFVDWWVDDRNINFCLTSMGSKYLYRYSIQESLSAVLEALPIEIKQFITRDREVLGYAGAEELFYECVDVPETVTLADALNMQRSFYGDYR